MMIKIVFVCLGNICRSPMAEGLMKKKVKDLNLSSHFQIESRATSTWEIGNPPHPKTQEILKRENANLYDKTAMQITKEDMIYFDVVIAMDHENARDLSFMFPDYSYKISLLRAINHDRDSLDVKDPYYTHKYEEVYKILNVDLDLWIKKFRELLNI